MTKVTTIGGGAWGTALACIAVRAGHESVLWCRSSKQTSEINNQQQNKNYLDALALPADLTATIDLETALAGSSVVLLAVPAQSLVGVLSEISGIKEETILVTTCKGIDRGTGNLPAQSAREKFPRNSIAALSGPSFAVDVVQNLPTAVTVASDNIRVADQVAKLMSTDTFRCYSTDDLKGVELGGALKNVLALAVGAARGMKLGASAEAALIARGFAEISRLIAAMGGRQETVMGLSGLGDITLSCSSEQSRNFTYGMALGKGENLEGLKLAEGAFTASVALQLAEEVSVDAPITRAVVSVLEKRLTAREAVEQLLTRPLKRET